jgi:hypothetical protein
VIPDAVIIELWLYLYIDTYQAEIFGSMEDECCCGGCGGHGAC